MKELEAELEKVRKERILALASEKTLQSIRFTFEL
jgi:hypothetical protein